MSGETNQIKWVGIRPTNPPENLPITFGASATPLQLATPAAPAVHHVEIAPWAASRSGVTRTQIIKHDYAESNTKIVHTVSSAKTFFLCSAQLWYRSTAQLDTYMLIRNASDVAVYTLMWITNQAGGSDGLAASFPMPIAVASLFDVCVVSTANYAQLSIQGWEE